MKLNQIEKPPPPVADRGEASAEPPGYEELVHFFTESTDLLCIAGFDGTFKHLNPAWERVLGWSHEELLARPFLDFVHPDDRPATIMEMESLAANTVTIRFENRYHCKDGSCKVLQWTANPMPELQKVYAVARDVTRQKRLEKQIIDTREEELARVGRDLHDSLGPHLVSIRYAAALLAKDLRPGDRPDAQQAEKIGEMADGAMALARNLVQEIYPVKMVEGGLSSALQDLARNVSRQTGLSVSFRENGDPPSALEVKLHLYRIAQEALNNACKHSGSRNVAILLNRRNDSLHLVVSDDGAGMAPSSTNSNGMGLDSMYYRARLLGGNLMIESRPGEGTTVFCEIPNRSPLPESPPS